MIKGFLFLSGLLVLSACGDNGQAVNTPAAEFIGPWVSDGSEVIKAMSSNDKLTVTNPNSEPDENQQDPCSGFDLGSQGVNAGVIKVTASGTVYAAQQVQNKTSPYIVLGQLNGASQFFPTPGTENDFVGGFQGFSAPGVAITPLVYVKYIEDFVSGPTMEMEIQVIMNSAAGVVTSPVIETRIFRKISASIEKNILNKAVSCFEKAKNK